MGVETQADRLHRDAANNLEKCLPFLKNALDALDEMQEPDCWGYDEYTDAFRATIEESQEDLFLIRKKLRSIISALD
jgi:hypothetical protein